MPANAENATLEGKDNVTSGSAGAENATLGGKDNVTRGSAGAADILILSAAVRITSQSATFVEPPPPRRIGAGGGAPKVGEAAAPSVNLHSGIARFGHVEEFAESDFVSSMDFSVRSAALCARSMLPTLQRQGAGQVLLISYMAGDPAYTTSSVWGATKWAVQGLAKTLRLECRDTGVSIATLCPGSVASPWWLEREEGGGEGGEGWGGGGEEGEAAEAPAMMSMQDCVSSCMALIDGGRDDDVDAWEGGAS